jgi:hypothetical protein
MWNTEGELEPSSREVKRLLRENEAAKACVREKLAAFDKVYPPRPARRRPSRSRPIPLDVKAAVTPAAEWAARGISKALLSAGFAPELSSDPSARWEGIQIETRTENAVAALLIQAAFRSAGIHALLSVHERARFGRVVVNVGTNGLDETPASPFDDSSAPGQPGSKNDQQD